MAYEYYAVDLPGKTLYDKEFSVEVRRITPIEQKFILSLSQKQQRTNKDYIDFIKKLVKINNPEVQFEDLYWFDVQYLLYKIRFTTYAKYPIKLQFRCNGEDADGNPCEEEIHAKLEIGDLVTLEPSDLPNMTRELTLDNLGVTKIRNKIMRDDITIDDFAKKNKIDVTDPQMRLLLLDLCLITTDRSLDELYNLADNGSITAEDIIAIENWFTNNIWGVKEEITVKCPKCGKEESRAYLLALEDFFSAF
jgi:hypothetical protein